MNTRIHDDPPIGSAEYVEAMGGPRQITRRDSVSIEVYQEDWIPGFAAFLDDGSVEKEAKAHVVLNLGSFMSSIEMGDLTKADLPYVIAESLMHEVMHVLEAWAGTEFNEERVESLLDKYREKYSNASSTQGE